MGSVKIPGFLNYTITKRGVVTKDCGRVVKRFIRDKNKNAYLAVTLSDASGKQHIKYLHRLLAAAFLNKRDPSRVIVNHIDGNKQNNLAIHVGRSWK